MDAALVEREIEREGCEREREREREHDMKTGMQGERLANYIGRWKLYNHAMEINIQLI